MPRRNQNQHPPRLLVWFFCIASLCSHNQSFALQPHHGRPKSSPRNFDNSNNGSGRKAYSSRVGPLTPPSSTSPAVRVDYARFRTPGDELDLQLGITNSPLGPSTTEEEEEWNVPLNKAEFEEFREKHARPGAAEVTATSDGAATQQQQQQQRRANNFPLKLSPQTQSALSSKNLSERTQKLVTVACVLAANAGFMNGVGLTGIVGKAQGFSAVTGAFTTAGVAASRAGLAAMVTVLLTPFFYMLGSFTNGLWHPNGVTVGNNSDNESSLSSSLRTGPLLLSATMLILGNGLLSVHPVAVLACWTFAMGLQNSWTSVLIKGNILRSAHFSGITSDIGTILGQTLRGNHENSWKLPIFAKLAVSFWAGGMVSAFMALHLAVSASTLTWMSTLLYLGMWGRLSFSRQQIQQAILHPQQLLEKARLLLPSKLKQRLQLERQRRTNNDRKHKVAHVMQ